MNKRDQELSLAIDAVIKLREAIDRNQFWRFGFLTDDVLTHLEAAADMPKPSKIRALLPPWRKAA
jgi:hypothetical protein